MIAFAVAVAAPANSRAAGSSICEPTPLLIPPPPPLPLLVPPPPAAVPLAMVSLPNGCPGCPSCARTSVRRSVSVRRLGGVGYVRARAGVRAASAETGYLFIGDPEPWASNQGSEGIVSVSFLCVFRASWF